ncbi:hypothetical protein [Ramlibacter sp. Leaf400]|uniref:hypothetical protein n=1 Tax=Ramlibacter sp. Leaf400 TaxID=1736365 RepID=UPI0012E36880|nr:hypothetical protein [Ramlibacter sp. Leaf400]
MCHPDTLDKAFDALGKEPNSADLDKLVATHFPGFRVDDELREAMLKGQRLLSRADHA